MNIDDYQINLIPFYLYKNNDISYYLKLLRNEKSSSKKEITKSPSKMKELCEILSSQDIIISMRYHCSLISLALGIPILIISYDKHAHYPNKMTNIRDLFNADLVNLSSFSEIDIGEIVVNLQKKKYNIGKNLIKEARAQLKNILVNL